MRNSVFPNSLQPNSLQPASYGMLLKILTNPSWLFCENSPSSKIDSLGLMTSEECVAQLKGRMVEVTKEGAKCMGEAVTTALATIGVSIIGGAVAVILTHSPPVGVQVGGSIAATGAFIDVWHYHHCMKPVWKKKDDAIAEFEKCKDGCTE